MNSATRQLQERNIDNDILQLQGLGKLDEQVRGISDAVVNRIGSNLEQAEDEDKKIGKINNLVTRKLYCAALQIGAESASLLHQATMAEDDVQAEDLKRRAHHLKRIGTAIMEWFWIEVSMEMNNSTASLGIRHGWMVIEKAAAASGVNGLLGLFGIG